MIGPRFLIVINGSPQSRAMIREAAKRASLRPVYESHAVQVLLEYGHDVIGLGAEKGIIIGTLFSRDPPSAQIVDLNPKSAEEISDTRGRQLIRNFWGSYLAILDNFSDRTVDIVRSPCSLLPCYHTEKEAGLILASGIDVLVEAGCLIPTIDWGFVEAHLQRPALRTARTGISGLLELQWGERLSKTDGSPSTIEPIWSPWEYADRSRYFTQFEEASQAVRDAIVDSTRAWASRSRHILLGVSGGLDSSILAVCLATSAVPFDLVTLVTDDAVGDEREFASTLAEELDSTLFELSLASNDVELGLSHASHLPRPLARSFSQSSDQGLIRLANRLGVDSFWSGGAGDSVFCFLQSTVPVADRILTQRFGAGVFKTACDLSALTGASLGRIIPKSFERAWMRAPDHPWHADLTFLRGRKMETPAHPWLAIPRQGLPGSAAHVAMIWGIQNYLEGHLPSMDYATVYPLLSQPVVETCLRVPSWMWIEGGINRAVARQGFGRDLPKKILERSTKGSPSGFVMALYEQRRDQIRSILIKGHLSRAGLLDLSALEVELSRRGPVRGLAYSRILTLVDVEAWLSCWLSPKTVGLTKLVPFA